MEFPVNLIEPFADRLRLTRQPRRWHAEGDVYRHTLMVCEALEALPEYEALPVRQRQILKAAATLHDIGKIPATKVVAGNIEAPHHAPVGSRMARRFLWEAGVCGTLENMQLREAVCLLIRYHSFPPHAIDVDDVRTRLHRIASNSLPVPDFSLRLLCILSKADMLGRECEDKAGMLEQVAFCEELAKEEGCFDECYPFPNECTRYEFLQQKDVWKEQTLHDDTWGTVYMMSGLPGTGKDTWIRNNLPDLPMVSLDELRRINKISPLDNQGVVANLAKEEAKEYLRRRQSFVWNATNLTQTMRQQLVNLFETYKARVCIVYLETDIETQKNRNRSREAVVPQQAIENMMDRIILPEAFEAREVIWTGV